MRFLYIWLFILLISSSVDQTQGATSLGNFGTVVYNENGDGLPISIPVFFDSDFPIDQDNKGVGDVWVEWIFMEDYGDGDLYDLIDQDADVAFENTGAGAENLMTFTVTPSGVPPPVGDTVITLDVSLKYRNTEAITLTMHQKKFVIELTVTTSEATIALSTADGVITELSTVQQEIGTNTGGIPASLPADGIALFQKGEAVGWGSPIVLEASTADSSYKLWRDVTVDVKVKDALSDGNLLYVWPGKLVDGQAEESGASNTLLIKLNSVPVDVYNRGLIYISLSVKYRDAEGGRRVLRFPSNQFGFHRRALDTKQESSADVVTAVQLFPFEDSSGSVNCGNALAMVGAALVGVVLMM